MNHRLLIAFGVRGGLPSGTGPCMVGPVSLWLAAASSKPPVPNEGVALTMSTPENVNPYESSHAGPEGPPVSPFGPAQTEGDATGGVIPYKNPCALIAYYLGIFALLPCIGIVPGAAAFILGIIGLQQRARNPAIKGSVHAWIGIVLGGLMTLVWGAAIVLMIVGAMAGGRRW